MSSNEAIPILNDFIIGPEYWTLTKPIKIININGHDVPEPVREPLEKGTLYYVPEVSAAIWNSYVWNDAQSDKIFLVNGVVHLTEEAAIKHAEALLSFTKSKAK